MSTRRLWFVLAACAVLALALPATAQAETIKYRLSSHPDGSEAPPAYGLRLDDLDQDGNNTVWLFDFDAVGSAMYLDWNTTTNDIHIYGTTWGGRDTSRSGNLDPAASDWWTVDFNYSGSNAVVQPNGVKFNGNTATMGSITSTTLTSGGNLIARDLTDWPNGSNAFNFLSEAHRGFTPTNGQMNGWGWLGFVIDANQPLGDSARYFHTNYQDWLFTATPVPEPGSMALVGLGLAGVAAVRRRRRRAAIV